MTQVGNYCQTKWKAQTSLLSQDFNGDLFDILRPVAKPKNMRKIGILLKNGLDNINDKPFIWAEVDKILAAVPEALAVKNNLRSLFEGYYYNSYLEEYSSTLLFDLIFDKGWRFGLDHLWAPTCSYAYFYNFLSFLSLESILDTPALKLIELRNQPEWNSLLNEYLKIPASPVIDLFRHNTNIRKKFERSKRIKDCSLYIKSFILSKSKGASEMTDVADKYTILVATDSEYKATLDFLKLSQYNVMNANKDELFYKELILHNGLYISIVRCEVGATSPGGAFNTCNDIINTLRPDAIIMGGICFGISTADPKQRLGDILISTEIWDYETEKIITEDESDSRGHIIPVGTSLLQLFRRSALDNSDNLKVHFGLMGAGDKIVNDKSFIEKLIKKKPKLIGGDMEGFALVSTCFRHKTSCILVKSICDWGYGKNDIYQEKAANNSISYIFSTLETITL